MRFQFVNFYEDVVINERNIFFVFAFSCKKLISSKSFIWKGIVFVYSIIKDQISRIKMLRNALNFCWNLPMLIQFLSDWILNCCIFLILWQTHQKIYLKIFSICFRKSSWEHFSHLISSESLRSWSFYEHDPSFFVAFVGITKKFEMILLGRREIFSHKLGKWSQPWMCSECLVRFSNFGRVKRCGRFDQFEVRLDIFIFQTENKTGQQRRSTVPCIIVSFHNSRRELKTDTFLFMERSNDQDAS